MTLRAADSADHDDAVMLDTANHGVGSVLFGILLFALGVMLVGDIWGTATGFRNLQARFYSGPVWAYRSIGLFGVVGGIIIIATALR
jgi:hypothetical protein